MTQKKLWIFIFLIAGGFALVVALTSPGLPVVILLIVSGFVAALFWAFWFFGENLPLRRFQPLKERLGFQEGPDLLEPLGRAQNERRPDILTGLWRGHKVQIQYHSFKRDERACLSIHLLHKLPEIPTTLFRRERLFHRWVKATGLSREADSQDPLFNQRVYVESERDSAMPELLASEDLRREILSLLDIPKAAVALSPEAVGITIHGHIGWPRYFQPERVQEILERLFVISKSLKGVRFPAPLHASNSTKAERAFTRLGDFLGEERLALLEIEGRTLAARMALLSSPPRLAIFISCLLMFIGPILFIWSLRYPVLGWRLPKIGLLLALISFLIYLPFLYFFVRGRSQSHHLFFSFLTAALIGFPSFWVGGLKVVNGLFDKNPPFVTAGQVVGRDREKPRLEVWVELPHRRGSVYIPVVEEIYKSAVRGQWVPVRLSPGALGEPWRVRGTLAKISP